MFQLPSLSLTFTLRMCSDLSVLRLCLLSVLNTVSSLFFFFWIIWNNIITVKNMFLPESPMRSCWKLSSAIPWPSVVVAGPSSQAVPGSLLRAAPTQAPSSPRSCLAPLPSLEPQS